LALNIIQGNIENLTGNCVVFWHIEGDNVFSPGHQIVAANFTISALPLEDKLLTATFPPIAFKDFDDLTEKLANIACDIIDGGTVSFPKKDFEFKRFYKQQFSKYNKIIQTYSEKYKDKFDFKPDIYGEKESLYMLRKMLRKTRNMLSGELDPDTPKNFRIKKLIDNIQNKYTKYDVENIYRLVYVPGEEVDKLTELYINKYISIFEEDYEKANEYNREIQNLEKKMPGAK
jgi:hypothetical protein